MNWFIRTYDMSGPTKNFTQSLNAFQAFKDSENYRERGASRHVEGFFSTHMQPPTSGDVPQSSPAVAPVSAPGGDCGSPLMQRKLIFVHAPRVYSPPYSPGGMIIPGDLAPSPSPSSP